MNISDDLKGEAARAYCISGAQTEYATTLRIPFLSTSEPIRAYLIGVVIDEHAHPLPYGVAPDNDEVAALAEHLEDYCRRFYRETARQAMRERGPFDIDSAANLGYYLKRPDGTWCYRKRTWDTGVSYWFPPVGGIPETLEQLIARNSYALPYLY